MSGPYAEGPLPTATEHEDDFARRVAQRLESTSTYVDVEEDVVDGLFSDVIDAVRAELGTPEAAPPRSVRAKAGRLPGEVQEA